MLVGDIHGCLEEFEELLKAISYSRETIRLILVGDLMDRGPDPIGCIRKAQEMGVEVLKGNHEDKHIRWYWKQLRAANGGPPNDMRKLHVNAQVQNALLSEHDVRWMENLPLFINVKDNWYATHAGVAPFIPMAEQYWKQAIRIRYVDKHSGKMVNLPRDKSIPPGSSYWAELWKGPENVVYGHCVHSLTDIRLDTTPSGARCVGIDTGCCFGGRLTAIDLDTLETVQVQAKKEYVPLRYEVAE